MLYLFYGNDFEENRRKRDVFLEKLFAKKPNASFFEYDALNFNMREIEELSAGQGLFEREHVVIMRGAFSVPEAKEFIIERLKTLADSPNVFIFVEEKLDAASVKKITAHAQKMWKSEDKALVKGDYNPFALGDAFSGKDRKRAWILFCRAADEEGIKTEMLHGMLFSQVKNMLFVKQENENPGLHPFVYQKTKRFSQKYSIDELLSLSSSLVNLYHDARRGICDMRAALESLILKI